MPGRHEDSTLDVTKEQWYCTHFLVDHYERVKDWDTVREAHDHTAEITRELLSAFLQAESFNDDELTALKSVVQVSRTIGAESTIERIRDTNIESPRLEAAIEGIQDPLGSGIVGGTAYPASVPDAETESVLLDSFETLLDDSATGKELDDAVETVLSLELENVGLGTLSPIFSLLHPERYPIVNDQTTSTLEICLGLDIPETPSQYFDAIEIFEDVRSDFGFYDHYRHLDNFCYWANGDTDSTDWFAGNDIPGRTVWELNAGHQADSDPKSIWPIWKENNICSIGWDVGDITELSEAEFMDRTSEFDGEHTEEYLRRFHKDLSPGEIVIAKDDGDLLGIGVLGADGYWYDQTYINEQMGNGSVSHPHLRPVEWTAIPSRDHPTTQQWETEGSLSLGAILDRTNAFEELRWALANNEPDLGGDLIELERRSQKIRQSHEKDWINEEPISRTADYYWVIQNNNPDEIEGEYLEAEFDQYWAHDLRKLKPSDTIIHYKQGKLIGSSTVTTPAYRRVENDTEYQRVDVEFNAFPSPVSFASVFEQLLDDDYRFESHNPVNPQGVNQDYLFPLPDRTGQYLLEKGNTQEDTKRYSNISEATAAIREQLDNRYPDNWLGNVLEDVIEEWTSVLRRNDTVKNGIDPNDVHVFEQLFDLYEEHTEYLQTQADRLGVKQIKNSELTSAQVLFVVLIRDLQLQADLTPNFNHVKMDQLLDERFRQPLLEKPKNPPHRRKTIARQLSRANQLVFHGPPGTGKTYTARKFSRWWVARQSEEPTEAQIEVVTFHPSFTYEDFIEGLAAREHKGGVEYAVEAGVFKRFCDRARRSHKSHRDDNSNGSAPPYVLIIDEINRGNLAQILGEIITLLEPDKRQDAANETATTLPHSNKRFSVPPNLYVIGTMNTADRSIALVDAALRRRFRFLHFPPDMAPLEEAYEFDGETELEMIATEGDAADSLLALSILAWKQLNRRIRDANQLGRGKQLGHSYLLGIDREADTTEQIAQIVDAWQFEILPLLEEYYYGQFIEIEQQLFDGDAGELIDTDRQEIRDFSTGELATVLADLTGLDVAWTAPTPSNDSFSNSLAFLAEHGLVGVGDKLHFDRDRMHGDPELRFKTDSDYWVCTIENLEAQKGVRWAYDGELHSLSELAGRIDRDHRDIERTSYAGHDYWYIPEYEDFSLLELARAIRDGEITPDQLRSEEI